MRLCSAWKSSPTQNRARMRKRVGLKCAAMTNLTGTYLFGTVKANSLDRYRLGSDFGKYCEMSEHNPETKSSVIHVPSNAKSEYFKMILLPPSFVFLRLMLPNGIGSEIVQPQKLRSSHLSRGRWELERAAMMNLRRLNLARSLFKDLEEKPKCDSGEF